MLMLITNFRHALAMNNLGIYYDEVEKNYDLMKQCYLMAIELKDTSAMNNLGFYYEEIEKDYDLMKKYYLMAIHADEPDNDSMFRLTRYYEEIEKNDAKNIIS